MKIIFDLDNTLALTDKAVCQVYNKTTGNKADYTKVKEWYYTDVIKDWTKDRVNEVFIQQEFFNYLEPIEGMYELLKSLQDKGHTIGIASVHKPEGVQMKKEWIKKHFPFIQEKNINIITGIDKNTGDVVMDKSCVEGDVMIDDHISNLKTCKCKYKIMYGNYGYQPLGRDIDGVLARVYTPQELAFVLSILECNERRETNGKAAL